MGEDENLDKNDEMLTSLNKSLAAYIKINIQLYQRIRRNLLKRHLCKMTANNSYTWQLHKQLIASTDILETARNF